MKTAFYCLIFQAVLYLWLCKKGLFFPEYTRLVVQKFNTSMITKICRSEMLKSLRSDFYLTVSAKTLKHTVRPNEAEGGLVQLGGQPGIGVILNVMNGPFRLPCHGSTCPATS
jgi:hypothetical protein